MNYYTSTGLLNSLDIIGDNHQYTLKELDYIEDSVIIKTRPIIL